MLPPIEIIRQLVGDFFHLLLGIREGHNANFFQPFRLLDSKQLVDLLIQPVSEEVDAHLEARVDAVSSVDEAGGLR